MKLLTQKKPRDLVIDNLSRKEIKLTLLCLLALTFQVSTASTIKTVASYASKHIEATMFIETDKQ